jgi:type VI secretion system protein ImpG
LTVSDTLLAYYERELLFIREMAQEFARKYPGPARGLLLEATRSTDPHVERLIESFALIAGRIHHKIDDEFPELTDAILDVLYPHYLAPIPSMAVVQFDLDPSRAQLPEGYVIERHASMLAPPLNDIRCKFRTAYPVTLWPITLSSARLLRPPFPAQLAPPPNVKAEAALVLRLETLSGMKFSALSLDRLRLFLHGDFQIVAGLYELIFNHVQRVVFRPLDGGPNARAVELSPEEGLFPVGFERDEGLLPYPNRSFLGYRLLTEFFAFPPKFHFFDLGGFQKVARAGFDSRAEVILFLNRSVPSLEQAVVTETFRLGCTPIVNLFEQTGDPVNLSHARSEYLVEPDRANPASVEVYSVQTVTALGESARDTVEYEPFYSFRHGKNRENSRTFWYSSRRPSPRKEDVGTDVYLHLVDLDFDPATPSDAQIIVRAYCTNRDLPRKLRQAGEALPLELQGSAPVSRILCVRTPTAPLRPAVRRGAYWRLISHLNLNHLSLADSGEGREALQEILRLYDFAEPGAHGEIERLSAVTQNVIEGITRVSSRRVVGRTGGPTTSGFARGVEVTIELDEEKYVGVGGFLFASVLERFLGLYASMNSFTQLVARGQRGGLPGAGGQSGTAQGREIKRWRPRAGELQLL